MKAARALVALAVLSLAGCGRSASAPEPDRVPAGATTVDGSAFLKLSGRWTLHDEQHPDLVTTITAETVDGAPRLVFVSTDHYNDRILYIDDDGEFFYMGNRNGSEAVGDAFPDDIRLSLGFRLWFQGHAGHPCPLLPSGVFTLPAEHASPHKYFQRYDDGREAWSAPGVWVVRWDLVAADTVRIRVDENFGSDYYFFDWYLGRSRGFTQIAWWADAARASLVRRIVESR